MTRTLHKVHSPPPMIELRDVSLRQGRFVLAGFSLRVPTGAHVALMGPTGCGKTTVLEVLAGLRDVTSGSVWLAGRDVTSWVPSARGLGYVPQDAAIFRTKSVRENLAFGCTARGLPVTHVDVLAARLGLAEKLTDSARDLSGGEAQRLALGRALAWEPAVLLLDEPFHALDDGTRQAMLALLAEEQARRPVTILHVAHDRAELPPSAEIVRMN
jgi:molybdate/tungstate transport system ATP-binding protein